MPDQDRPTLEELLKLHPADLADQLQRFPLDEARELVAQLPRPLAAKVFVELEEDRALELLAGESVEHLAHLLGELPPHEAADVAGLLDPGQRRAVLSRLPDEPAQSILSLLHYPEDTAGGIMSDRFIALPEDSTVQECQELLRQRAEPPTEDVSYLYVVDWAKRLKGVVSLRDLVFRQPHRKISELVNTDVRFVRADSDQEEIARQFEHYHYMGLPVVDRQRRLIGVVKASDALEIAQEEATEDMQLMVGLSGEERALTPWRNSIGKRLPWLYVNLATAFLAAAVVGIFEDTIAQWTALAVFLPIVAGQGGNAGMQTLTVIIRDMALGELSAGDGRKALFKEVVMGLLNGLAIGLAVGVVGYIWKGDLKLGLVAGAAMVLNLIAAATSGVLIPFGLKMFKVDPALASSIFLTTVTDVMGFFFFLGLGALAIHYFV